MIKVKDFFRIGIISMEELKAINGLTRKAYNKAAGKYYDMFYDELDKKPYDIQFVDTYLNYLGEEPVILDVGCGPCGHIDKYISRKGYKVVGIDLSEKCVEIARNHSPGIQFLTMDFAEMGFGDSSFDGIVSYYSVIDTPKKYIGNVLSEFRRVLKKNGLLFLTVKSGGEEGFQNDLLGINARIYFSLFTENELRNLLENKDFEILKLEKRKPYGDEINVDRLYSISKKRK